MLMGTTSLTTRNLSWPVFITGIISAERRSPFEFLTVRWLRLLSSEERLWRVFCELDANNDNYITTEELARVLGKRSNEAEELLKEVDTNHDGKISYSEFLHVWKPYC
mmetsp:Transcript_24333/g.45544  ORF Transcript_24333/g.45544 Transcript_24333/m.45544 type:complete len:108 (-) Transcript_24333:175-498(-)